MKTITSEQNPLYKALLKLQRGAKAREEGVFLVEGLRSVREVIKSRTFTIRSLWMVEAFLDILPEKWEEKTNTNVYVLPRPLLQKAAGTVTPQGILAVVERKTYDIPQLLAEAPEDFLGILLENIQDPGNLGTILRTADAAGCHLVILTEGCTDEYSQKVVRSSMGSLLHLPVCHVKTAPEAAALLKERGITLLAGALDGAVLPYSLDLKKPVTFLIGNEGNGLTKEAKDASDYKVKLPIPGQAESLNAGVAAGILLYEAVRQRN